MVPRALTFRPQGFARWCLYALAILVPGSFAVIALVWLARRYRVRYSGWRTALAPHAAPSAAAGVHEVGTALMPEKA